ncbi:MAG: photosynthetic complex assembly protein PuhC [Halioglobus sp.]|jgi:putative photosynthetic complex assembly protein
MQTRTIAQNNALNRGMIVVGAVVLATLVAVATARLAGYRPAAPAGGAVVASADLRFEDAAAGVVRIYDWHSGRVLADLEPGDGSFIRGVLRSLVRERRSHELGTVAPFHIARHADGQLTLEDTATGRRIELQAFGPTNAGAFAALLDASLAQS